MGTRQLGPALLGALLVAGQFAGGCRPRETQVKALTPKEVQTLLEFDVPDEAYFVPGQVILKLREDTALSPAVMSTYGVEVLDLRTSGGEYIYRIPPAVTATYSPEAARDSTLALVRVMGERPEVLYAQPNWVVRLADRAPDDPRFGEQWHYSNNGNGAGESPGGINLPSAWDMSTGSADIAVSILDTGILPDHEDISGSPNLISGYDMISDVFTGNDGDGRDDDPTDPGDGTAAGECRPGEPARDDSWHGTHVAGTVGVGNTNNGTGVAGVNWTVSVQAVRVLGRCGGSTADINDAIRWAAGLSVPGAPDNATPARVINMSLGTPPGVPCTSSPSTQSAINDAVAAGAAVVVAAGNDATDASQVLPASCDNVITVAASDYRGHLVGWYSNFGATVEIMAPGGDVLRDDNGDGNPDGVLSTVQGGYAYYNGTSMATPHVAGVAALWLAQEPQLTPAQLLDALQANAIPRNSTQCPRPCGAGLLNAFREPGGLAIRLSTASIDVEPGATQQLSATVTQGGVPQPNVTVAFATGNANVATVAPASDATDANGIAETTVRGASEGTTTVTATADGASASATVTVAEQVPDLSLPGLVLLALIVLLIGSLRRRYARSRA